MLNIIWQEILVLLPLQLQFKYLALFFTAYFALFFYFYPFNQFLICPSGLMGYLAHLAYFHHFSCYSRGSATLPAGLILIKGAFIFRGGRNVRPG
jgi:hypothetical protein